MFKKKFRIVAIKLTTCGVEIYSIQEYNWLDGWVEIDKTFNKDEALKLYEHAIMLAYSKPKVIAQSHGKIKHYG